MIPPEEVAVLDANAAEAGIPAAALMKAAGQGLAASLAAHYLPKGAAAKGTAILFACGPGNNGGDGYVAAEQLRARCKVTVAVLLPPRTALAKAALAAFSGRKVRGEASLPRELERANVIVDALLGVGARGQVREPLRTAIGLINAAAVEGTPIVSVDVPSGLGTDCAVSPKATVTFHDRKVGMDERACGTIEVVDIGIPQRALTHTGRGEVLLIPIPGPTARKRARGSVLIIGGGPYHGAPLLAAVGAGRCGVDLVHVVTPPQVVPILAAHHPNLILHALGGDHLTVADLPRLTQLQQQVDAVVLGPGLGRAAETIEAIRLAVSQLVRPTVIDADALVALGPVETNLRRPKQPQLLLTPHDGEFDHLMGARPPSEEHLQERIAATLRAARRCGCTVLLKGRTDLIAAPDGQQRSNETGCPPMAVGGTGDVLAGVCGALLSKGLSPFQAARAGAWLNGKAGEAAAVRMGHSLQAIEVAESLPAVLLAHHPLWKGARD